MKEIEIYHLSQQQFNDMKARLKPFFKKIFIGYKDEENSAFTMNIGDESKIFVNDGAGLTPDELTIVLAHEKAHAHGIKDEEQADKWAMKFLNDKQKDLLIQNWKDRHGHDYK